MATLRDIAEEVGVSTTTVSLVLNKSKNPLISKGTKQRILQAVERLHYAPNRIARDLARGSTMVLGMIVPKTADLFFGELVEGIEEIADSNGYEVMISYSAGGHIKERKCIQSLLERKVDGFIIAPLGNNQNISFFKKLCEQKFPFVFVDRYINNVKTDFVVSDLKRGAYEAVSHLIRLGHRKIAHITENINISTVRDVSEGYKMALEKNGLYELVTAIGGKTGLDEFSLGYNAVKNLLRKKGFTAIFCVGDDFAIGAMKALQEAELKVPEDISMVGMDNLSIDSYLHPPLTSVAQDKVGMGRLAGNILIERIKNHGGRRKQIFMRTNLIERESARKVTKE